KIEEYTGQVEFLGGRVKTLHPKIHGGLLARRDESGHMNDLASQEILPIDVAVVNLYPFIENLKKAAAADPDAMVELIDIGGPAMIRAAAKNHRFVLPLIDPGDYPRVIREMREGEVSLDFRRELAAKVFATLANYNLEIARYFSGPAIKSSEDEFSRYDGLVLEKRQSLRYGENPHQKAAFYSRLNSKSSSWEQLSGKELSYNNLLDFDAALGLIRSFRSKPSAVIVKHLNPCGVASSDSLISALQLAKLGDPRSHFGGIVAFNGTVDSEVAQELREGFVEIVLAPDFDPSALELLKKRKNLRIVKVDLNSQHSVFESRVVEGGVLWQERDSHITDVKDGVVVSKRKPTIQELEALNFAWIVCSHVKSNAIVLAKGTQIQAVGAGQMSRVDSAELAVAKARTHNNELIGSVVASDAFFPFPDSVELLLGAGATAIVAPGGASRDDDVIAAADKADAALIFMKERHFRH
ncbi:MAG: bifunctional phosphoribosylaminoimidazolecarboxamide formyltransferase/IMP cyclohydrolase, partial [Bdellovibrionales bacterium]|nr:bifunctional phosphoribosylaminoimidazolecarboxamide formyltransferase/IMP cyclohydrolase [Bdellovibrionales bacterium]